MAKGVEILIVFNDYKSTRQIGILIIKVIIIILCKSIISNVISISSDISKCGGGMMIIIIIYNSINY